MSTKLVILAALTAPSLGPSTASAVRITRTRRVFDDGIGLNEEFFNSAQIQGLRDFHANLLRHMTGFRRALETDWTQAIREDQKKQIELKELKEKVNMEAKRTGDYTAARKLSSESVAEPKLAEDDYTEWGKLLFNVPETLGVQLKDWQNTNAKIAETGGSGALLIHWLIEYEAFLEKHKVVDTTNKAGVLLNFVSFWLPAVSQPAALVGAVRFWMFSLPRGHKIFTEMAAVRDFVEGKTLSEGKDPGTLLRSFVTSGFPFVGKPAPEVEFFMDVANSLLEIKVHEQIPASLASAVTLCVNEAVSKAGVDIRKLFENEFHVVEGALTGLKTSLWKDLIALLRNAESKKAPTAGSMASWENSEVKTFPVPIVWPLQEGDIAFQALWSQWQKQFFEGEGGQLEGAASSFLQTRVLREIRPMTSSAPIHGTAGRLVTLAAGGFVLATGTGRGKANSPPALAGYSLQSGGLPAPRNVPATLARIVGVQVPRRRVSATPLPGQGIGGTR